MHPEADPVLATERLRLLPFAAAHLSFLHALWTEPRVRRFLWDDRTISRAEAAEVVEASVAGFREAGYGLFVIVDAASGQEIGFAGLRPFDDPPEVELLYALLPPWWGQGIATEAARAVLHFGFTACRLPRIFAGADPPNAASLRVIERLGMRLDGRRVLDGVETLYYVLDAPASGGER